MKLTGRHNLIIAGVFVIVLLIFFAIRNAHAQALTIVEKSSGGETMADAVDQLKKDPTTLGEQATEELSHMGEAFGVGFGAWILSWFY